MSCHPPLIGSQGYPAGRDGSCSQAPPKDCPCGGYWTRSTMLRKFLLGFTCWTDNNIVRKMVIGDRMCRDYRSGCMTFGKERYFKVISCSSGPAIANVTWSKCLQASGGTVAVTRCSWVWSYRQERTHIGWVLCFAMEKECSIPHYWRINWEKQSFCWLFILSSSSLRHAHTR